MTTAARRWAEPATILVLGTCAILVTGLLMGLLAKALQDSVDVPIYAALEGGYRPDSWWAAFTEAYTQIGDPIPMVWQVVVASLALAVIYRRRWWIPAITVPVALGMEWFLQKTLEFIVDRGHPPAGMGTFPSGGSARFVAIYGVIVLLGIMRFPGIPSAWRWVLVGVVGVASAFEGYTRLYLLKHWPTDIPAGLIIGALILLTMHLCLSRAARGDPGRA